MGTYNGFNFKMEILRKESSEDEVRKALFNLINMDFSKYEKEDDEKESVEELILNKLNTYMLSYSVNSNLIYFLYDCLNGIFKEFNNYYKEYKVEVKEIGSNIVIGAINIH